jgi:hypothetical protein
MRPGNLPQGNKSSTKNVASQVMSGKKTSVPRVGNTVKDGQMDKPFKG